MRIREVGSKFVLTDYQRSGRVLDAVKGLDFVQEVFLMGDGPLEGCTPFDTLLQDSGDGIDLTPSNQYLYRLPSNLIRICISECPKVLDDVDMNSAAWLAYTSGTTGLAKCIDLTHNSIVGSFSSRK